MREAKAGDMVLRCSTSWAVSVVTSFDTTANPVAQRGASRHKRRRGNPLISACGAVIAVCPILGRGSRAIVAVAAAEAAVGTVAATSTCGS